MTNYHNKSSDYVAIETHDLNDLPVGMTDANRRVQMVDEASSSHSDFEPRACPVVNNIYIDPIPAYYSIDKKKKKRRLNSYNFFKVAIIVIALLLITLLAVAHVIEIITGKLSSKTIKKPKHRNVIFMVSDGCGPASMTYARQYHQYLNGGRFNDTLPIDSILVGTSRTRSDSSWVTDSAAGATAFSCGIKTYNGAISVGPDKEPCGTVLEAAKLQGYLTGLVVTSRITDATPATFSSHVDFRYKESDIALQQIGNGTLNRVVDIMFGGGACFFKPNTEPNSCRDDSLDLLQMAKDDYSWDITTKRSQFDSIDSETAQLPLLGLYADSHLDFEIDRNHTEQPALHELAKKAIDILHKKSHEEGKGFFLLIEGSRIDMAAHNNDPVGHVHDILEYNRAIEIVKQYVEDNHDTTTMISISDHETGGFSIARQLTPVYPEYLWVPEAIEKAKYSSEYIANRIVSIKDAHERRLFVKNVVFIDWLGIQDAHIEEIDSLSDINAESYSLQAKIGLIVSLRAQLGWATHGHSAVDVNIYSYGRSSNKLSGNHENIDINEFIRNELDLNLDKVTDRLRGKE